jgi:hypothetical protein
VTRSSYSVGKPGFLFSKVRRARVWNGAKADDMKWMLVALVGGVTPVNTDLVFDKFTECLAAEEQMRKHYADAFEAWDRWASANIERRREYTKARDLQAKRLLSNIGTCIPHGGGDQPTVVAPQQQPATTPSPQSAAPQPSPTPQPSPKS